MNRFRIKSTELRTIRRKKVAELGKEKGNHEPGKREVAGLAGYCSRLAGENMCRCGSNLKGRYCLWTHYPLPPSLDKHLKKDN